MGLFPSIIYYSMTSRIDPRFDLAGKYKGFEEDGVPDWVFLQIESLERAYNCKRPHDLVYECMKEQERIK